MAGGKAEWKIVIDLDEIAEGRRAPSADGARSIHQEAFAAVLAELAKTNGAPSDARDGFTDRPAELDITPNRRHEAILINARRGEGKTRFLVDVLSHLQSERASGGLYSLGIIDPTLIETKQNIVGMVVERIWAAVRHHAEIEGGRRRDHKRGATEHDFEYVRQKLHALALGIQLLDGMGGSELYGRDWADPDYVLDRGLEAARDAHGFERAFGAFVSAAADFMQHRAFVLAIDDVDTWFDKGWPVLEALRKHLVSPRLKLIVSGDMNLFSVLVRRQQWEQMSSNMLAAERSYAKVNASANLQIRRLGQMIDSLQDQYLIKVLPPRCRIDLRSLMHYADRATLSFNSQLFPNGTLNSQAVMAAYAERVFALRTSDDKRMLTRALLRQPVRTAVHALAGARRLCGTASAAHPDDAALDDEALPALRHVAWTALALLGLDPNVTREVSRDDFFDIIGRWLASRRSWADLADFAPDHLEDDRNIAAMYLGAILAQLTKRSPGASIDYML